MSSEVVITINSVNYTIRAKSVKRAIKNTLIKVQKPLTKSRQDGTNVPETLAVDIKRITDMLTIVGEIHQQTISTPQTAVGAFNLLATAFKTRPGPYTIVYRGVTYSGLFDQLESEDKADTLQSYVNSSNVRSADIPSKVNCTISFTICTVK